MKDYFYKRKDSSFHRLNSFLKLGILLALAILSLAFEDFFVQLAVLSLSILIAWEAKVLRGLSYFLKVAFWIAIVFIPINLLINPVGSTVLFEENLGLPVFETIKITLESFYFSFLLSLRLAAVIAAFALVSLTISPREMMRVMFKLRLPAKFVFITSLSARFVPSLLEDLETLTELQKARGAKLEGIRGKAPVLLPLLSNSLERSVSVAEAMQSRGITGKEML